ncbi:hypothetical protein V8E54_012698 [Elaphomyces granulatus]
MDSGVVEADSGSDPLERLETGSGSDPLEHLETASNAITPPEVNLPRATLPTIPPEMCCSPSSHFDHPNGGLHYGTAILACALIAGNAWNGFFTETVNGPMIMMGNDQLLREENYYFHVPSSGKEPYPIYPSFEHWRFPHNNLPPSWYSGVQLAPGPQPNSISASNLSPAIISRGKSCQLTGYHDGLEGAHLCPQNEYLWFRRNGMAQYNLNRRLTFHERH